MGNEVIYVHTISFINLNFYKSYFIHSEIKDTKKIRENPEKWGCDSFR